MKATPIRLMPQPATDIQVAFSPRKRYAITTVMAGYIKYSVICMHEVELGRLIWDFNLLLLYAPSRVAEQH